MSVSHWCKQFFLVTSSGLVCQEDDFAIKRFGCQPPPLGVISPIATRRAALSFFHIPLTNSLLHHLRRSHIFTCHHQRRRSQILTKTLCGDTQLSSQRIGVLTIESRVDVLRCHRAYIVRDIRRHLCDFGVNRHRDTRIGDEPSDHEAFAGMRILP